MRRMILATVIFTVFVCSLFAFANPVLCSDLGCETFSEGEVFIPSDGVYDFRTFCLNASDTCNFTVKYVESGHTLLVDETGNKVINVVEPDRMTSYKKGISRDFIENELSKTGWMVNGVEVHEIEFRSGYCMYAACTKDTSTGIMIYLATPSDAETAEMMNTLKFG